MFYKMAKLGKLSNMFTTYYLDSGSDSASSGGSWYTKKTENRITSIFLLTEFLIREHFNNIHNFLSR